VRDTGIDLCVNRKLIRDFLLIVTLALSATVFEILMLKSRKWLNFPTPPLFEASARGVPLECLDEIWHQKTRIVGLPDGEEIHDASFLRFRTIPARIRQTDGQTDGQTDRHVAVAKTRASIALRGKKGTLYCCKNVLRIFLSQHCEKCLKSVYIYGSCRKIKTRVSIF